MDPYLTIENLIISKAYDEVIEYIYEAKITNLYTSGILAYASYKKYHDEKYLDYNNPYCLYFLEKDLEKAYKILLKETDVNAYLYLGLCYYRGEGTIESLSNARTYFKEAINRGSIPAKTYLAQTHLDEEDFTNGYLLLRQSDSFVLSAFYLGNCFFNGYGVVEDKSRAERYYIDASKFGFDEACYTLAMHYLASDDLRHGMKQSLDLLHIAACKGHERALLFLIQYYCSRDNDKYMEYLVKAAIVGNRDCKYHIGYDYLMGINLPQDKEKAYYWLRLAAQENHEQALHLLQTLL